MSSTHVNHFRSPYSVGYTSGQLHARERRVGRVLVHDEAVQVVRNVALDVLAADKVRHDALNLQPRTQPLADSVTQVCNVHPS